MVGMFVLATEIAVFLAACKFIVDKWMIKPASNRVPAAAPVEVPSAPGVELTSAPISFSGPSGYTGLSQSA